MAEDKAITPTKEGRKTAIEGNGAGKAEAPSPPARQRKSWTRSLPLIIGGILILAVIGVWALGRWRFGLTHVSTDDAYVTGNLVNVSPTINGRLSEMLVEEGQRVHKGQLLA